MRRRRPEATLDEATIAKIEAMVEQMMAETGTPGYALGIVNDGQIVYTKGFGVERVGEDNRLRSTRSLAPAASASPPWPRRSCSWWMQARSTSTRR
jgi:CubicO group peptidase (beta-lactamase class C family)